MESPPDLNSQSDLGILPTQEELEFKRKNLPDKPGVYLYKDEKRVVIYVGKAKSLKKRVNSYFKDHKSEDPLYAEKINRLVSLIRDIDVFVVENESEALLLENGLIKKYQPHFNALLKDDKSFPWVMVTKEKYPRIRIVRNPEQFGYHNKFIGPFVEITDVRHTLAQVRKIFPFCTCKNCAQQQKRSTPCINYQIKLCPAPCTGKISEEDYRDNIQHIEDLLNGKFDEIEQIFKTRMQESALKMEYELAAVWRNRLQTLQSINTTQSVYALEATKEVMANIQKSSLEGDNTAETVELIPKKIDIVAGHTTKTRTGLIIIHVREGKLLGKTPYIVMIEDKLAVQENFFIDLFQQHYLRPDIPLPDEIILEYPLPEDIEHSLQEYFKSRLQKSNAPANSIIEFTAPKESNKTAGLLRIAKKNIELLISQKEEYEQFQADQQTTAALRTERQGGLLELQNVLEMDIPPLIIEAFDMSNIQGTDPVGSMVTFVEGAPSKAHYRRFKIRSKSTPDDVGMMRESMGRRYERAIKEQQTLPDLIVVDGGKGQLNMAHQLLTDLGLDYITHIGLAKREEEIIIPDQSDSVILPKDSAALHILQAIRDEAHRFAITYHRKLREKRQSKSELDDIPGIGPARKKKLLQFFGSMEEIRAATNEKIADIVGTDIANKVTQYLVEHPQPTKTTLSTETIQSKRKVKKTSKKEALKKTEKNSE